MIKRSVAVRPQNLLVRRSRSVVSLAVAAAIASSLPAAPASAQDEGLSEVTITGSRIVRRDLEASSPIMTVDSALLEDNSTISVESALNQLPQFKPAGTQFVAGDVQASAFNNPGVASLNLRGLGANRNLVLIDGRRAQPANATLVIDVNTIPLAAIETIETISGGASAVYGADAIAGVVNFKLKRNFQGFVVDAQSSITEEGDGAETRIAALLGGNFGDGKGNVMMGLEWSKREAVLQADRDFYVEGWEDIGTTGGALTSFSAYSPVSTGTAPSQAAVNQVFGTTGTTVSRTTNFFFNNDGTLFKQAPARRFTSPRDGVKIARNNSVAEPDRTPLASSPLDRYSIFARGNFTFNDNVSAFVQGNLSSTQVDSILGYAPATSFWGAMVPRDADHPVPAELAALLDSRADPNAPWQIERVLDFVGPRASTNRTTVYQVLAGLQGDLGLRDWTWEAYVSHGETSIKNVLNGGFVSLDRWRTLVAAPNYGRGFSFRDPNLGYAVSCTSGLPFFENFQVSQDCIDAITIRMKNNTDLTQDIAEANFQGGLFALPAGEVRAAAGFTHRINKFHFDPDTLNDAEQIADAPIGLFAANDTNGSTRVNEFYAELLVPLLKDLPAVRSLELELGARHSSYDTAGKIWTYKALANWGVTSFMNIRGGYQQATRAPNTAELFTGPTVAVAGFPLSDPCANTTRAPWGNLASNPNRAQVQALCSALNGTGTSVFDDDPNGFIGGNGGFFPLELERRRGNTQLKPEEAKTITVGVVFRSPFESAALSGFTAALDYYSIKIDDAISALPGTTVYENCFNSNGVSNPTYSINDPGGFCALIQRDGTTGGRVSTDAPYLNLGTLETDGIDAELNWRASFADIGLQSVPGTVTARIAFNYLLSYKTQSAPGGPIVENEGTLAQNGQFQFTALSHLGYQVGDWTFGLNWRYLPSVRNAARATNPTATPQGAHSYSLFDLTTTWAFSDTVALRLGIDNLLDQDPEVVGFDPGVTNAKGTTVPGYYDILGRRAYLGVRLNF